MCVDACMSLKKVLGANPDMRTVVSRGRELEALPRVPRHGSTM